MSLLSSVTSALLPLCEEYQFCANMTVEKLILVHRVSWHLPILIFKLSPPCHDDEQVSQWCDGQMEGL